MKPASRSAVVALALAGAGCVTPPAFTAREGDVIVRAPDEQLARELIEEVEELRDALSERIPGLLPGGVEIWLQDELVSQRYRPRDSDTTRAFTVQPWLNGVPEIHVVEDSWHELLPHELVHAWLGPDWDPLPAVLEEGLCDLMTEELGPYPGLAAIRLPPAVARHQVLVRFLWDERDAQGAPLAREISQLRAGTERYTEVITPEQALSLDSVSSLGSERDPDVTTQLYGHGYVLARCIVERQGVAGLHALCERARRKGLKRVPAEWVMQAAADGDYPARLEREYQRATLEQLRLVGDLESWLRQARSTAPQLDAEAWLASARPRVAIDGGAELLLSERAELRDWLDAVLRGD